MKDRQPDLFAPAKPPRDDRKVLTSMLKRAQTKARRGTVNGMTPEQFRRQFPRKLPRVTVPR